MLSKLKTFRFYLNDKFNFKLVFLIILFALSSYALALYLQFQPRTVVGITLFFLSLFIAYSLDIHQFKRKEIVVIGLFCVFLDATLILGYHISINGDIYFGLASENYIDPYSFLDIIAFLFMLPTLLLLSLKVYSLTAPLAASPKAKTNSPVRFSLDINPIELRKVALLSLIPFLCWLPYLLIYWPGFIFGDSLSSLSQALGWTPYTNRHPFIYTLFIQSCIEITKLFGFGHSIACALYCLIQMALMSFVFSYLSIWIKQRLQLKYYWALIIILIFSLSPYIATYSIALWKDPIFSVGLVLLTLLLMDFVLSKGKIVSTGKSWSILLVLSLTVVLFWRNNGLYVLAFIEIFLFILWIVHIKKSSFFVCRSLTIINAIFICMISLSIVITGPIYKALDVSPSPKVESVGILLNQMARVAALDGEMTSEDREYLNSILPLNEYEQAYTPTTTDNLKWDSNFNSAALEDNFFQHWFSLFAQNPRAYFEAWELQTFGFWAINEPNVFSFSANISSGVPRNTNQSYADDLNEYQISADNKLNNDSLRSIFTQDNQSVPISFILWGLVFLSICLVLRKKSLWLIALLPSLALLGTLIVASPIWYWPRYGAAVQFLIPFYAALVILLRNTDTQNTRGLKQDHPETNPNQA